MTQPVDTTPDVPPEVARATIDELERMESAEAFSPPPFNPLEYTAPARPASQHRDLHSYSSGVTSVMDGTPPKEPKTLEDLYAMWPKIGDGVHCLRVMRTAPKSFNGHPVAGWIEDLGEQLPMPAFQERFGGGTYEVTVMAPVKGVLGRDGQAPVRSMSKALKVEINGRPAMGSMPQEMYMNAAPGSRMAPLGYGQEAENVVIARLRLEEERAKRADAEKEALMHRADEAMKSAASQPVVDAVRNQAQAAMITIKDMGDAQVKMLQDQNLVLMAAHKEKDAEVKNLREKITSLERDVANTRYNVEQDIGVKQKAAFDEQIRTQKAAFDEQVKLLREEHNKHDAQKAAEHLAAITTASARYTEDRSKYEGDAAKERERISRDYEERSRRDKDDAERRERAIKEQNDARVADMIRTSDRELAAIKDSAARELQSTKDSYERELRSTDQTHKGQITTTTAAATYELKTVEDQMRRAQEEARTLRRECEELRTKVNKDVRTVLAETREMATDILGMVPASEAAAEAPFDWKREGLVGMQKLIENMPAITEKIGQMARPQQPAGPTPQQLEAAQHQQMALAQGQARQRAAGQRKAWSPSVSLPGSTPFVSAPPIWGQPPPNTTPNMPPKNLEVPTLTGDVSLGMSPIQPNIPPRPPPPPMEPFGMAPPLAPSQPPQAMPAESPTMVPQGEITPQQQAALAFVSELEQAISNGLLTPFTFATGVVQKAGPELAAQLLQNITPEQLFEQVEQIYSASRIVTRTGRQYTREVWAAAAKILGGMQQTAAA